ncbi:hypothetical protein GIB67_025155 [Kingdonia uniflora]|uniref:F-box domain-containing protein n=1 Tax=Kingdonia uniflora TaxID=39325 RepID=A0A7J7N7T4_9MAGN|nr:hypothetical protein GIB67_025155 [Kingdonia uniflora]
MGEKQEQPSLVTEISDVDRISDLPDPILHHVLSFVSILYSVRTCVLSRRWRNLWRSVPCIDFNYDNICRHSVYSWDFVRMNINELVNSVIRHRDKSNIDIFRINLCYYDKFPISNWIRYAIKRKEQVFDLMSACNLPIPSTIFTYELLQVLKLDLPNYRLHLPTTVRLPNLKTLDIVRVRFDNDQSLGSLISSCPILEALHLNGCETSQDFTINAPNLKTLDLSNLKFYGDQSVSSLFASCSLLETLVIRGRDFYNVKNFTILALQLKKLSVLYDGWDSNGSLVFDIFSPCLSSVKIYWKSVPLVYFRDKQPTLSEVEIGCHVDYDSIKLLKQLLTVLFNAESVDLSGIHFQFYSRCEDIFDSFPIQFYNLKRLKVQAWSYYIEFCAFNSLLQHSPNIETLIVQSVSAGTSGEVELIKILLDNAMVLENMIIDASSYNERVNYNELQKICEELKAYPRASTSVRDIVHVKLVPGYNVGDYEELSHSFLEFAASGNTTRYIPVPFVDHSQLVGIPVPRTVSRDDLCSRYADALSTISGMRRLVIDHTFEREKQFEETQAKLEYQLHHYKRLYEVAQSKLEETR